MIETIFNRKKLGSWIFLMASLLSVKVCKGQNKDCLNFHKIPVSVNSLKYVRELAEEHDKSFLDSAFKAWGFQKHGNSYCLKDASNGEMDIYVLSPSDVYKTFKIVPEELRGEKIVVFTGGYKKLEEGVREMLDLFKWDDRFYASSSYLKNEPFFCYEELFTGFRFQIFPNDMSNVVLVEKW